MKPSCQKCGAPLRTNARGGHCPRCLLLLASPAGPASAPSPDPELPESLAEELLHAGQVRNFGDYELLGEVARGGMGVVYRARQRSLNREVAMKMILAGQLATPESVQRFRLEAEAAAHLHHPNIVPIYEVGEHETQHYFTMKLVEGGHLGQLLDRFGLPAVPSAERAARRERQREIARLLVKVANALSYAHQRGILHRDLKPSNILVDAAGEPHLTDFGLARIMDRASGLTLSNAVLGSPAYMAPEQAAGKVDELTTAVDIYGLGALLYELLSGRPPHVGDTAVEVLRKVLDQEPARLSKRVPDVDRDLETICHRCLETLPERRYRSARAVAEELERFLRDEPIDARPVGVVERLGRWCRRRPAVAGLGAAVLVATFAGALGVLWQWRAAELSRRQTESANRELAGHLRRVEWQQAEAALGAGRTADAMATFARFVRETPDDPDAGARLRSLLETRAFPLPLLPPMKHGAPVRQVRVDSGGRILLTVADDGVLRRWNLSNGQLEREAPLNLAGDTLEFLAGERVLVRRRNGRLLIWNDARWQLERELPDAIIDAGNWGRSEDGRWLSLVTPAGDVQSWNAGANTARARIHLPRRNLKVFVDLGADGETLIVGEPHGLWMWDPGRNRLRPLLATNQPFFCVGTDWPRRQAYVCLGNPEDKCDAMVRLDLDTGQERARLSPPTPWHSFRASPDGRSLLLSRWGAGFLLVDPDTFKPRFPWRGEAPVPANASPDAALAVCFRSLHDGSGRLYDLATGRNLMEPVQHDGPITSHRLTPDGARLVTGSEDGTARLWDLRMRERENVLADAGDYLSRIALSPDGQRLALATKSRVQVRDTATGRLLGATDAVREGFNNVRFSPDGRFVAAAGSDRSVRLLEAATGRPVWENQRHTRRVWTVFFSPDGTDVAGTGEDGTIAVFDTVSGTFKFSTEPHADSLTACHYSADGRFLSSASFDATARVWDASNGRPVGPVFRHLGTVRSAQFSRDGRHLLTASADRTAQIWDIQTGARVAPPIQADESLLGAAFTPDDRQILVHTLNTARMFDARTSRPVTQPMPHRSRIYVAQLSPDGRWVGTGSADRTARVWDARTGFPITEPLPHQGMVFSALWMPGRRQLITGSDDGMVRAWTLPEVGTAPDWLPDLAETLAGKRAERDGGSVPVPMDRLDVLRGQALTNRVDDPAQRWLKWFLVDRLNSATQGVRDSAP